MSHQQPLLRLDDEDGDDDHRMNTAVDDLGGTTFRKRSHSSASMNLMNMVDDTPAVEVKNDVCEEKSGDIDLDKDFHQKIDHYLLSNPNELNDRVMNGDGGGGGEGGMNMRLQLNGFVPLLNRFVEKPWQLCRNPRLFVSLCLQFCIVLVSLCALACVGFKMILWLLFVGMRVATIDNNSDNAQHEQHHHGHDSSMHMSPGELMLHEYANLPLSGYGLGVFFAPFYAASFYCCLIGIPLAVLILLIPSVFPDERFHWSDKVQLWMKRCALMIDVHLTLSLYCAAICTGFIARANGGTLRQPRNPIAPTTERKQRSILFWNMVLLLFNLVAAIGSSFPFTLSKGNISLLVSYYLPVYCLVVLHLLCVPLLMLQTTNTISRSERGTYAPLCKNDE